jgi:hypothetical protein
MAKKAAQSPAPANETLASTYLAIVLPRRQPEGAGAGAWLVAPLGLAPEPR